MTRRITADRTETTADGRTITTATIKRYCDRDHVVGDASDAEIEAAIAGRPMPDVTAECRQCTPNSA